MKFGQVNLGLFSSVLNKGVIMTDFSQLIHENRELLDNGNSQKVIANLSPICKSQEVPFQLHLIFVHALMDSQQYREAYEEALHFEQHYQQNDQYMAFWIQILLKNSLFIPARIALLHCQHNQKFDSLKKQIETQETNVRSTQKVTLQNQLRHFYHIGDQNYWQQRETLDDADQLPIDEYLQGAQFVLRDPYAKPLIRTAILQTLSDLKINITIKFIWIDNQVHQIVPARIGDVMQMSAVTECVQILQQRLGDNNPIEYRNAVQRLRIQVMVLYPFVNSSITNPQVWVAALLGDSSAVGLNDFQDTAKRQRLLENKIK